MNLKVSLIVGILLTNALLSFGVENAGLTISGQVLSKKNTPVASTWVQVSVEKDSITVIRRSLTGDDGKYFLSSLLPGNYLITILPRKNGRLGKTKKPYFQTITLVRDTSVIIKIP